MTLYGRNADALYYFKYVEGTESLFTTYSMAIIIPSIIGAGLFPIIFRWFGNKGRSASILALGTGVCMLSLYLFSPVETPVPFYICSGLTRFFFAGFNTAIYAIIPDCVEYGEWKTGVRMTGSSMHLSLLKIKSAWQSVHLFLQQYREQLVLRQICSRSLVA